MAYQPFMQRSLSVRVTSTRSGVTTVRTFDNARVRMQVTGDGAGYGLARVAIYGQPLQVMNALARMLVTPVGDDGQDAITVTTAGRLVYTGRITFGFIDFGNVPDVALVLECNSVLALQMATRPPFAGSGAVPLYDALSSVLAGTGFSLDFDSVALADRTINSPRVVGSAADQVAQLCKHFPDVVYNVSLSTVAVYSAVARTSGASGTIKRIARDTGLVSYPQCNGTTLTLTTLYDPMLSPGQPIMVDTPDDAVAGATWLVAGYQHQLDARTPGGAWFTRISATYRGATA